MIQAIGRWRPYRDHGRKFCDIFLLNNYDTELAVRPVSKTQLYQFLELPFENVGPSAHVVAVTAHDIMQSKGKVKNSDIRDRIEFKQDAVGRDLGRFAKRVGWVRDEKDYYHEE